MKLKLVGVGTMEGDETCAFCGKESCCYVADMVDMDRMIPSCRDCVGPGHIGSDVEVKTNSCPYCKAPTYNDNSATNGIRAIEGGCEFCNPTVFPDGGKKHRAVNLTIVFGKEIDDDQVVAFIDALGNEVLDDSAYTGEEPSLIVDYTHRDPTEKEMQNYRDSIAR